MALIIGIERSRAMRRSQNYAQDCLAGLIGDLQALTANVYLVETLRSEPGDRRVRPARQS